jgi:hypothetical protein
MKLIYRRSFHGLKEMDLFRQCEGKPNTVMIIKNEQNKIFGGYLKIPWYKSV